MIGWNEIYNVLVAMTPLYVALMLGYGSVKWWRLFTIQQCDGINRFICLFILPLFTFDFTANVDPYKMNYRLIAADTISKVVTLVVLAVWSKCSTKASFNWCITTFSLCTLTNLLVVGVPLVKPMYGDVGVNLVVQLSVVQALFWFPLLLFFLEFRKTRMGVVVTSNVDGGDVAMSDAVVAPSTEENGERDIEGNVDDRTVAADQASTVGPSLSSFIATVSMKLAANPNVFAVVLGVIWAFMSNRLNFEMPRIIEGSVTIMSKAGTGTAMFNIGIFIATQKKLVACGKGVAVLTMVLRFLVGPATMAVCSVAVGLRGDALRIAIIQAALPQAITSFVFAKEYGLHANVLSTAVVFGTLISLPLLIGYYAALDVV